MPVNMPKKPVKDAQETRRDKLASLIDELNLPDLADGTAVDLSVRCTLPATGETYTASTYYVVEK